MVKLVVYIHLTLVGPGYLEHIMTKGADSAPQPLLLAKLLIGFDSTS